MSLILRGIQAEMQLFLYFIPFLFTTAAKPMAAFVCSTKYFIRLFLYKQ